MKKQATIAMVLSLVILYVGAAAQDSPFKKLGVIVSLTRPPAVNYEGTSAIRGIQRLNNDFGIVHTDQKIFRTDSGGEAWRELSLPISADAKISSVFFTDKHNGWAVSYASNISAVVLNRTEDGGNTWKQRPVQLENVDATDTDLRTGVIRNSGSGLELEFRIVTSSNFVGRARYLSVDDGESWTIIERNVDLRTSEEPQKLTSMGWTVETEGVCEGFKTGCFQETTLASNGTDITPPELKELLRNERTRAKRQAVPRFAVPPGGSTRISLNRGFDKCTAGTVSQMKAWWDNSPLHDANIYMSGRNRGCAQPQLTAAWVDQVSSMGWGLIPTIVGYQSPCTSSATTQKFSYDPAVAESQGREEAGIAVNDAINLGLTAGSILYYDMERYDETGATPGCRTATKAFLKGWTERINELNFVSGTYGSPKNAQEDWLTLPPESRMHAIWMARWDNVPNVWTYVSFPTFPTNEWDDHQRIKQWQAPHNETWGGVTFNIDGNIADGPVAGHQIPRNRTADFDGDLKTDISVFRPSTGQWFVSGTRGPSYNVYQFGADGDVITPGDYDGDGKTDLAVFRPSNATWYILSKGSYYTRQYGAAGDIPAAADYDGDGRTDIAVFRPSTGVWYIAFNDSRNSFGQTTFGQSGDMPVKGDFDGDGKADIAVWRPSNGNWYVLGSTAGYYVTSWGMEGDQPAQGDHDGDGKTDLAFFRAGNWFVLRSTDGLLVRQFGIAGDIPVIGDYDGDGADDIAVFRPSNATWYMSQTQNGYVVRSFGATGDKPVPAGYLP